MVTYLDAALAPQTSPTVRLFALVCLLRADGDGLVRLPRGLLRGWRLADRGDEAVAELTRQHWLHEQLAVPGTAPAVRIDDGAGAALLRTTSRRHRRRLLDQAARLTQAHGRAHGDRLSALPAPGGTQPAGPSAPVPVRCLTR